MAEGEEEKKKIEGDEENKEGEEFCPPLGFRFMPKDEELIKYYLLPKLQGRQHVPNDAIIEDNVYTCHPNQLIEKHAKRGEKKWYFLSPRERKYEQGKRPARNTGDGLGRWKASTGSKDSSTTVDDKKSSTSDGTVYSERVLGYFRGSIETEKKTKWLMHELMVPGYANEIDENGGDNSTLDDYVMCKIYVTPRKKGRDDDEAGPSCPAGPSESPSGTSSGHDQLGHPSKLSEKAAGKRPVLQERQPPCRDAAAAKRARHGNPGLRLGPPAQQVPTQTRPVILHGGGSNTQVPFGGAGRGLAAGRPMAMRGRPRAPMPMPMPMSAGYRGQAPRRPHGYLGQAAAPMGYQYHGAQAPRPPPAGYRDQAPVPFIGQRRLRQAMATMRPSCPAAGQAVKPPSASQPPQQQQQPQQQQKQKQPPHQQQQKQKQPETEEMRKERVIRQHMEEYYRLGRQGLLPSSMWPPPCYAAQQQRPTMPFAQQQRPPMAFTHPQQQPRPTMAFPQQQPTMAFTQQQRQGPTMAFTQQPQRPTMAFTQQEQQPPMAFTEQQPYFVPGVVNGYDSGMAGGMLPQFRLDNFYASEAAGEFQGCSWDPMVLATGDSAGAMAPAPAEASVLLSGAGNEGSGARDCIDGGGDDKRFVEPASAAKVSAPPAGSASADGDVDLQQ